MLDELLEEVDQVTEGIDQVTIHVPYKHLQQSLHGRIIVLKHSFDGLPQKLHNHPQVLLSLQHIPVLQYLVDRVDQMETALRERLKEDHVLPHVSQLVDDGLEAV